MGFPELAIALVAVAMWLLPLLAIIFAVVEILKLRRQVVSLERRVHQLEAPAPPPSADHQSSP